MTIHPRGLARIPFPASTTNPVLKSRHAPSSDSQPCLSVGVVAAHYQLTEATVGAMLRGGALQGVRMGRRWRMSWRDVWAGESGPQPQGDRGKALKRPLLRKSDLASACGVSVRTVERWLADGLPTRNVGHGGRWVRIAPADAEVWLLGRFGLAITLGGA